MKVLLILLDDIEAKRQEYVSKALTVLRNRMNLYLRNTVRCCSDLLPKNDKVDCDAKVLGTLVKEAAGKQLVFPGPEFPFLDWSFQNVRDKLMGMAVAVSCKRIARAGSWDSVPETFTHNAMDELREDLEVIQNNFGGLHIKDYLHVSSK